MTGQVKFQEGLTKEQIEFLQKHKIHPRYVFNAKGIDKGQYKLIMKELNKGIAFNVSPCKAGGHTLRTRSGHCCQCDTARLAFQTRHDSGGIVYIAGSVTGKTIKVGFTKTIKVRAESLNRTRYAGFNDWEIIYAISSKNAGQIETSTNVLLQDYELAMPYMHDGHWQDSFETFKCSASKAKEILLDVCAMNKHEYHLELDYTYKTRYEFKDLLNFKS